MKGEEFSVIWICHSLEYLLKHLKNVWVAFLVIDSNLFCVLFVIQNLLINHLERLLLSHCILNLSLILLSFYGYLFLQFRSLSTLQFVLEILSDKLNGDLVFTTTRHYNV